MDNKANHSHNKPSKETHAKFAGDATGAVGGDITPMIAPDKLPHEPLSPSAHIHDPGKPSHEIEDAGWVKEEQGSALAQEAKVCRRAKFRITCRNPPPNRAGKPDRPNSCASVGRWEPNRRPLPSLGVGRGRRLGSFGVSVGEMCDDARG